MRAAVLTGARAVLLAGPTVLAFFAGGYFDEPRAWAGLAAWALVVVALVFEPSPVPRGRAAWLAIGGLAAFAGWTLLSMTWAPLAGSAYHAGQIVVLYLGILLAAAMLTRSGGARSAVEPALAAGALIVIGYGLSERLLPELLTFSRSVSAQGRLEQPLTYWNAMGELAALGFVLCASIAGESFRPRWMRAAAAAAAAPLGLGLYISFSRGAVFACVVGLIALVTVSPRIERIRAVGITVAAAVLAALSAAWFSGVTSLVGSHSHRVLQGSIVLVLLLVIAGGAAVTIWRLAPHERTGPVKMTKRAPLIAGTLIAVGLALAIVVGAKENSRAPLNGGATRFETLESNRYAYWRVAFKAFDAEPLHGVGAGGWAVYWLRDRTINEFAQDAHSLPIQTLAELGIVGFVLLLGFAGGLVWVSVLGMRASPGLAAGPIAGLSAYAAHAPLDWDWQMPAVTLVAMVLGGALIALAQPDQSASAILGASRRKIHTASTQITT